MLKPLPYRWALALLGLCLAGCGWHGSGHLAAGPLGPGPLASGPPQGGAPPLLENPLFVPVQDREFAWNQLVDTVDSYFKIERESRVRVIGGVVTEGRIDTFPLTGASLLEPWRRDSTRGFQRWQDTFQSTRRRAVVRVFPAAGGYLVDLAVFKELEDLSQPEHATTGGNTLRHDGTLVRQQTAVNLAPVTLGWIPLGRDLELEQRMLQEIRGRLTDRTPARRGLLRH
jgi:hypothetical protein